MRKIPKPNELQMASEQIDDFLDFIKGDDLDFYEEFTMYLSDKEQKKFFEDNPNFMSEYQISYDRIYLMRDKIFRGILRKIKRHEGGKENGIN